MIIICALFLGPGAVVVQLVDGGYRFNLVGKDAWLAGGGAAVGILLLPWALFQDISTALQAYFLGSLVITGGLTVGAARENEWSQAALNRFFSPEKSRAHLKKLQREALKSAFNAEAGQRRAAVEGLYALDTGLRLLRADTHAEGTGCLGPAHLSLSAAPAACATPELVTRRFPRLPAVGGRVLLSGAASAQGLPSGTSVQVTELNPRTSAVRGKLPDGKLTPWLLPEAWQGSAATASPPTPGTRVRLKAPAYGLRAEPAYELTADPTSGDLLLAVPNRPKPVKVKPTELEPAGGAWNGPYPGTPRDPWGREWVTGVEVKTGRLVVGSCGTDGVCEAPLQGQGVALSDADMKAALKTTGDDLRLVEGRDGVLKLVEPKPPPDR